MSDGEGEWTQVTNTRKRGGGGVTTTSKSIAAGNSGNGAANSSGGSNRNNRSGGGGSKKTGGIAITTSVPQRHVGSKIVLPDEYLVTPAVTTRMMTAEQRVSNMVQAPPPSPMPEKIIESKNYDERMIEFALSEISRTGFIVPSTSSQLSKTSQPSHSFTSTSTIITENPLLSSEISNKKPQQRNYKKTHTHGKKPTHIHENPSEWRKIASIPVNPDNDNVVVARGGGAASAGIQAIIQAVPRAPIKIIRKNIELHQLQNSWTLYYHSSANTDWSNKSYKKFFKFNTIEEFYALMQIITPQHYRNGLFFLMRDDIPPYWECEQNRKGGAWSLRIQSKYAHQEWMHWAILLISNNITTSRYTPEKITGINMGPKSEQNYIIKIWNTNSNEYSREFINFPPRYAESVMYRKHDTEY